MNVKAVVKVMNFHALLRVEKASQNAMLYSTMQNELESMMSIIMNNRALRLDKKIKAPDPNLPVLRIYLGSDFGFCGSVNSSVSNVLGKDNSSDKVVVGKKLRNATKDCIKISFEDYMKDSSLVDNYIDEAVHGKKWSAIEIVYNHFYNLSNIKQITKKIYPLKLAESNDKYSLDDFVFESDVTSLIENMMALYLKYEIKIATSSSYASENTMRQNATTESLKKLDERESEELRVERKIKTQKSFEKTIDSYIKQKSLRG